MKITLKLPLCLPKPLSFGFAVNLLAPGDLVLLLFIGGVNTFFGCLPIEAALRHPKTSISHAAAQMNGSSSAWQPRLTRVCDRIYVPHYLRHPGLAILLMSVSCELYWCQHIL